MEDSSGIFQRILFNIRWKKLDALLGWYWILYYRAIGMEVGKKTRLYKMYVTWPHQVSIGASCCLEHHLYFHFDGIYKKGPSITLGNNVFVGNGCEFNIREAISIGHDCLIGAGCKFIDHDHGFLSREIAIRVQSTGQQKAIVIGDDVWLGANVIVLKGITIGRGAVVAAGAVVTMPIPDFEIWGGVPAKCIGKRPNTIHSALNLPSQAVDSLEGAPLTLD